MTSMSHDNDVKFQTLDFKFMTKMKIDRLVIEASDSKDEF